MAITEDIAKENKKTLSKNIEVGNSCAGRRHVTLLYQCCVYWRVSCQQCSTDTVHIHVCCSPLTKACWLPQTLADDNEDCTTASFMDLIRTPKMRKHTFILSFNW